MSERYCSLCRRSWFEGRGHRYSLGHRRRLREALRRLREEVEAAGSGAVRPVGPAEGERRVWCPCCQRAVRRDGRCGDLALPRAALLRHLAGPEHRREAVRFWRENRVEAAERELCLVSAEEYERFAQALEQAVATHRQQEEERIQQVAAEIREAERRQRETVQAALQLPAEPELRAGPSVCSPSAGPHSSSLDVEQPGPCGIQAGPDLNWMEAGQALTFIGHQEAEGKGNVHTGAKPPWLTEEEEGSKQEIGPSYEEFLKQKEKQKLRKLPPERVGANFDHTSETGESWLPSFGRVWNHGRRWQSRLFCLLPSLSGTSFEQSRKRRKNSDERHTELWLPRTSRLCPGQCSLFNTYGWCPAPQH
ncbi:centrosomal AT-AC splicing factor isoform X2 [Phaenicophaeus curvirostris]|uniref:centrosomal AT-AC splicing factor isoform X2 n=1 Tax=Phaenicophaeus curvirostris TaxID=33595 RepID=UPI0037F0E003